MVRRCADPEYDFSWVETSLPPSRPEFGRGMSMTPVSKSANNAHLSHPVRTCSRDGMHFPFRALMTCVDGTEEKLCGAESSGPQGSAVSTTSPTGMLAICPRIGNLGASIQPSRTLYVRQQPLGSVQVSLVQGLIAFRSRSPSQASF